jgi:hypothetical protein
MTRLLFPVIAAVGLAQTPTPATLMLEGKALNLPQACAALRDNAEGLLDSPLELRILLTDQAVAPELIQGLLPVFDLTTPVAAGAFKGVLLRMNPADPTSVVATLLTAPRQPGASLINQTLSSSPEGPFKRFTYANGRVSGLLEVQVREGSEDFPAYGFTLSFDLPVLPPPTITENLKGGVAQGHPTVKALKERAQSLAKGDLGKALDFSAPSVRERDRAYLSPDDPQAKVQARAMGPQLLKALAKVRQVIVRGSRAVVLLPEGNSFRLIKVDGTWKVE